MSVEIKRNFNKVIREVEDNAAKGAVVMGERLIKISNSAYTPKDTGELAGSAFVEEAFEGAVIVYDKDYAARLYTGFVNNYNKEKNQLAGPFWIDRAAADNKQLLLEIVAKQLRGDL